jgi:hypothetical protein
VRDPDEPNTTESIRRFEALQKSLAKRCYQIAGGSDERANAAFSGKAPSKNSREDVSTHFLKAPFGIKDF